MNQTSQEQQPKKPLTGIGGWLLLPALALALLPISFYDKTIGAYLRMRGQGRIVIIWPALIADCIVLLLVGLLSLYFFKKKSIAPALFIIYIVLLILNWSIAGSITTSGDTPIIPIFFLCLVIFPYLVYSRRVKNTFQQPLQREHGSERLFMPLESMLIRFLGFLRRTQVLVPLYAIFLVAFFMVFYSLLRSLYIYGNFRHFIDLLF